MHTSGIKRKMFTNMSQLLDLYTYCFMNKQYVKGLQRRKKG